MHSAFLQTASGWTFTDNPRLVLEHDGDLFVNADEEERDAHLMELAAREGGETAVVRYQQVVVLSSPLYKGPEEALAEARAAGSALCEHASYWSPADSSDARTYAYPSWSGAKDLTGQFRGFVLVPEGPFLRLSHNPALWAAVENRKRVNARKEFLAAQKKPVNRYDFEHLADECAIALGCSVSKSFRIEQLWIFLAAHDAAYGKRATNKLALLVARRWCRDRKRSKKWLGRWASDETVRRTDERLAAVCRKSAEPQKPL